MEIADKRETHVGERLLWGLRTRLGRDVEREHEGGARTRGGDPRGPLAGVLLVRHQHHLLPTRTAPDSLHPPWLHAWPAIHLTNLPLRL